MTLWHVKHVILLNIILTTQTTTHTQKVAGSVIAQTWTEPLAWESAYFASMHTLRQYDTSLQCLFVRNFELFEFCMFAYLCMFDHFWAIRVVAMVWCFYSQPKFTTEQASVHSSPCLSALIFRASIRMSLESSVSSAAANHWTPIPRSQLVCHSEQLHARTASQGQGKVSEDSAMFEASTTWHRPPELWACIVPITVW